MQVTITHQEGMKFEAKTEKSSFIIDCPVISPIEYFLSGIIACTATDIIQVPKNQGYEVKNLSITGDVVRNEDMPRKFNALHLQYSFECTADNEIAARWVMASIETYCSTLNTIRDTTQISYDIDYNGTLIRDNEQVISGQGGDYDLGEIDACGA